MLLMLLLMLLLLLMVVFQDVVDSHPGLTFLQDAPEFHSRYVQTVNLLFFCTVIRLR